MPQPKRYEIRFSETAIAIIEQNRARLGGLSVNKFVNLLVLCYGDRLWAEKAGDRFIWIARQSSEPINPSLQRISKSISFSPAVVEVVRRNCKRLDGLPVNRFVNAVVMVYGDCLNFSPNQSST